MHQMMLKRPADGHKGTFGHALLFAGSRGMAGAAMLAAEACLRSGVGKLSIVTEEVMHDSERTQDFQDLNLWRQLVVEVAGRLVKEYDRDLIVPMTLCNPDYFRYIRNGFERISPAVFHFCLTADYGTIHARLTKRGDAPGSWAFRQTERCLKAYAENPALFETILPTDGLSEDEVCGRILEGVRQ